MKIALMLGGNWTTSSSSLPLNAWSHVAVVWDGVTSRFYINGVLDSAVAVTGTVYRSSSPIFIGRQGSSGTNYFDGTLDEVRLWSTARNSGQIQTNLNRTLSAGEPGLAAYWRFEERTTVWSFDASGNGNHGPVINRPVRVPSFWAPVINVNGADPFNQECHAAFVDPGTTASATLLGVSAGGSHALALRADGGLIGWGSGGPSDPFNPPGGLYGQATVPASATNTIAAAGGGTHSLALKRDGTVLGWGNNSDGQITIPPGTTNIVAIAAGSSHSLALRSDGTVLAWGNNQLGQANVPSNLTNVIAIASCATANFSLALKSDGTPTLWGAGGTKEGLISGNAVAIAAGGNHGLALLSNGTVVGWGDNSYGQISPPSVANNLVGIAAGNLHSLTLRADGTVLAWGYNLYGQTSVPPNATNIVAIAAAGNFSLALRADGKLLAWGTIASPPTNPAVLGIPATMRGSVGSALPGTYALTYSLTNQDGAVGLATRKVQLADTIPPALSVLGANPLNLDVGTGYLDPGATAIDACAGDLTANITRSGTVNAALPGSYTLTYTVTDPSGNTATTNRTVLVRGWPSVVGFNAFFSGTNPVTGSPVVQFLADINPNGLPTGAYAQYGLNTSYPGRSVLVNLPASFNVSSFFATLDGLVPGATYHFRVTATNSLGVAYGPDQTFTVPLVFKAGDLNTDGHVSQSELDSVLSNYWSADPGVVMTNPVALGNGIFQFGLTNASGWDLSVLVSTNLIDWETLPTPARPAWQFLDPGATNLTQRFYRLRWP